MLNSHNLKVYLPRRHRTFGFRHSTQGFSLNRVSRKAKTVALLLLVLAVSLLLIARSRVSSAKSAAERNAAVSRGEITIKAAGRGKPYLNFQDGQRSLVNYRGVDSAAQALRVQQAQPRSLAAADLDRNVTPDLIAGYAWNGAGIVTVQRGNPDAFAPTDQSVYARMQQGYNPDSLLPDAEVYQAPEPVDFLQAGDFDDDNRMDVLAGAMGGDLFLLAGDGYGGLKEARRIDLPGAVTALTTGEFRAADGRLDIAVGINGPQGPEVLVFDGAAGGFESEPFHFPVTARAVSLEFGELDSDPFMDLAIADGSEINIVHGWGRKVTADPHMQVERIPLAYAAQSIAVDNFTWDRQGTREIAVLTEDGSVRVLENSRSDKRPLTPADVRARAEARGKSTNRNTDVEVVRGWTSGSPGRWSEVNQLPLNARATPNAAAQGLLTHGKISTGETNALMVVTGAQRKLDVVHQVSKKEAAFTDSSTGDISTTSLDVTGTPVAMLALPKKLNGTRDMVVLTEESPTAVDIPIEPLATFTVNTTSDHAPDGACNVSPDCTLREAVIAANANPGADTISLPAGTYNLTIIGNTNSSGAGEGFTGNPAIGDLDFRDSPDPDQNPGNGDATTVMGAGAGTTFIVQTTANDRVLEPNPNGDLNFDWTISGVTIAGGRDTGGSATGGGGAMLSGSKDNTTTITNCVIANNRASGAGTTGGGGVSNQGGTVTITNTVFGGATTVAACPSQTATNCGNSASSSGGGIGYSPGDPFGRTPSAGTLTIQTTSSFQNNTANSLTAGGGGADLYTHNLGTGSVGITGTTFTSNAATGTASGGAIIVESIATTVGTSATTTSFTNNTAGNRAGGISVAGGSLTLDATLATITFTGNTAGTPETSTISTAATTTAKGTHLSLDGDLEVTTNGTWTNQNGTGVSISPTNVVIQGTGIWNSNDSTTNVAGNFKFLGGTFNAGTGLFNFNGAVAQAITNSGGSITFNNLTDSNTTQPLTLNQSFAVSNTLSINGANAIFDPVAAAVISGAGTLTGTGTARVRRTAATADFSSQYTITNKTLTNLTVEYTGAAAQVGSALTYGGLKINNANGVNLAAGTTIVNNTLTLTAGALGVGGNTLTINNGTSVGTGSLTSGAAGTVNYNQGSIAQNVLAANYGNLTFSAFTKVLASSGTIGIAGTFNTGGIGSGHTITGSTIDFNGTGAQSLPVFNFNNLTISGARTTNSVTLINGGTIGVAATFSPTATFTSGNFIITNNTMDFNGAGAQSVAVFNYNSLTISGNRGGAAITLAGGNIGIAAAFSPSATNNTYTTTGDTVIFNGAATQTIPAFTFNGLTLNNGTGANLGGDVTVGGALTLTAGALGVGTNTLTLNGAVSTGGGSLTSGATGTVNYNQGSNGQATVLAANYGNLTFSNFNKTLASSGTIGIAGTFTPGSGAAHTITGSTINFNGAGAQTIPGFTYNNLTSSGGVVGRTLDAVNTIKIAGVFTPGTNTYTITGSTIEYNGTSAQSLPSSGFNTYNNLTLNNAAGTSGFGGLTVNGLIEVKAGTFTSSSSYNNVQIDSGATLAAAAASTINVSGNWTNNGGTFTPNTGTVNLNGVVSQTIGGTGATTFNNLTVSNANTINMTNDNTVNGVLALTSADITVAATKTLTQPVGGSSSGGFDVNGRVQRTGFVSGGSALSFGNPFNTIQVTAGTAPANIVVDLARSAPVGFSTAVQRTYTITPSAGGFTGTLRLHYLDSELNGNTEGAGLLLRRFNGSGWAPVTPSSFDASANWAEKAGVTTFSPWTLSSCCSPTVANGAVGGRITDGNGAPIAGAVVNLSGTQTRKMITDANGRYQFDNVDTLGFYTVTPSRTNYNFSPASRSFTQEGNKTEAAFTGSSMGDSANPVDTPEYFVRQQYVDVLGREPDEAGFNYWSDQLLACGTYTTCMSARRQAVAAAFFMSDEFQASGSYIYDLYAGALGRRPGFAEYSADRAQVVGGATLYAARNVFAQNFVQRNEFTAKYQDALGAESFIDALLQSVQSSGGNLSGERSNLIGAYNQGTDLASSRAVVIRSLADNAAFKQSQYNQAFVLTEYFGYLRREIDLGGYNFWVNVLNTGDPGNYRGMVCSFVTSREYQNRFGQIVTHSNGECGN